MSYRNPQIYAADPMAFSRGFTEAFDKFQGMFEKEKAEREALKRQEEAALARGYAAADIGRINKIDLKLNQGLQQSLNSVVESRQFADAGPAEQQRMLQELGVIKSSMQRIGEIAAIEPENWDSRNSKTLTAFRNAVLDGDDSIEVIGEGLNMRIKGSFGEITLDDISNAKVMTKEKYQDIFDNFQDKFTTTAIKRVEQVAKIGGNVEAEKQRIQEDYKKQLRAQGPELLSYLYSNEVDSDIYDTYKSFVYADPNITKDLSNEQKDKFINDQFNSMAENMYSKAMDSFIDPTPYIVPPKPKTAAEQRTGFNKQERVNAINKIIALKPEEKFEIKFQGTNDFQKENYEIIKNLDGTFAYRIKPPAALLKEEAQLKPEDRGKNPRLAYIDISAADLIKEFGVEDLFQQQEEQTSQQPGQAQQETKIATDFSQYKVN